MHSFFYYIIADIQTFKSVLISIDLEKLDLFGEEYLYEYFNRWSEDKLYKDYIAEELRTINNNVLRITGGRSIEYSFEELVKPREIRPHLSADEIVANVNASCGLIMIDNTGGEE